MEIARELFFEQGFESVSMRKIADRAGCSPMTLYHYFPNKHAILQHIWTAIFDRGDAEVAAAAQRAHRTETKRLHAMAKAFAGFWARHPEYFHIVYLTTDPKAIELGATVLNAAGSSVRRLYDRFEVAIARCVDDGELAGPPPAVMTQILFSGLYGMLLCVLTVPEYDWLDANDFTEEAIAHFIRGYSPG